MKKIIFALALGAIPVATMAAQQTLTTEKVSAWISKANANFTDLYTNKANSSCFADSAAFNACFDLNWPTGFDVAADYTVTGAWDFTGATVTGIGGSYTLPTASSSTLGGVKVGSRLTITDGVLSADVQSGTGAVDSVNGNTGTVVLDADDIGDTSTTKKFTTTAEKTTWNAKQNALTAGTDYLTPTGSAAGLTNWPTLNQNTTGSAARLGTARTIAGSSFDGTANIDISYANLIGTPTTTPLTAAIVYGLWAGSGYMKTDGTADSGGGGATSLIDMTDWPSGLTLAELGYVGDVTGPIQAQIDSLSAGGIPHVSSGYPSTAGAWNYNTTDNRLYTRKSNGDVYYTSALTLAAAADVTPTGFAFTDVSDATLSTQYTACDQVTGIDWPATVTASGGTAAICTSATYATDCGTFGTSPGTVANNGWVCARHTSSASNSTATNTAVTVGTESDTFTTTTAAASGLTPTFYFNANSATSGQSPTIGTGTVTIGAGTAAVTGVVGNALEIDSTWGGSLNFPGSGNISATTGTLGFYIYSANYVQNGSYVSRASMSSPYFLLEAGATAQWRYMSGGVQDLGLTNSTWSFVELSWDYANGRKAYRINGGTWQEVTGLTGSAPTINDVVFGSVDGNVTSFRIDQIIITSGYQDDVYSVRDNTSF